MQETKNCPFCGGEILSVAKKCKFCKKFLEKQCPCCKDWINIKATKCKHCGTWLNKFSKEVYEGVSQKLETEGKEPKSVSHKTTGCLMIIECGVLIALVGYIYNWTWWIEAIAVISGVILLNIQTLRIIYCFGISVIWGLLGFVLGPVIVDDTDWETLSRIATDNYADYWWAAVIVFAISLYFHWPATKQNFNF